MQTAGGRRHRLEDKCGKEGCLPGGSGNHLAQVGVQRVKADRNEVADGLCGCLKLGGRRRADSHSTSFFSTDTQRSEDDDPQVGILFLTEKDTAA